MSKVVKKIAIIVLMTIICLSMFVFVGCDNNTGIDTTDYVKVTYELFAGTMDKLHTRIFYAKNGSLLKEPTGTASGLGSGLAIPALEGYYIEGWYSEKTSDEEYVKADDGEYVYTWVYIKNTAGEYVLIPFYFENANADTNNCYVALKGAKYDTDKTDVSYEKYVLSDAGKIVDNKWIESLVYTESKYVGLEQEIDVGGKKVTVYLPTLYDVVNNYVLYDADSPQHNGLTRYEKKMGYVAYDVSNPEHDSLQRFSLLVSFNPESRWDWKKSKVPQDVKDFTLYVNWQKSLKVIYNYQDEANTQRTFINGISGYLAKPGEPIEESKIVPYQDAKTFTSWYKDKECTQRWNFKEDVFPKSKATLNLYAGYVDGLWERILTVKDLSKVVENLSGNYLLLNNLDLGGTSEHPLGFATYAQDSALAKFTGKFNGYGNTISNFRTEFSNTVIGVREKTFCFGLFPILDGATITNLNIVGEYIVSKRSISPIMIGAVAGEAKGGTVINNCSFAVTIKTSGSCESDITYGKYFGNKTTSQIASILSCINTSTFALESTGSIYEVNNIIG